MGVWICLAPNLDWQFGVQGLIEGFGFLGVWGLGLDGTKSLDPKP